MLMTMRIAAVLFALALGASSAYAHSMTMDDWVPDDLTIVRAVDANGGYTFKCCTDNAYADRFHFADGMGEWIYDPDTFAPDPTWLLSGDLTDGSVLGSISMAFSDFDETTKEWSTGLGYLYDEFGVELFELTLKDKATAYGDHGRIWAYVYVTDLDPTDAYQLGPDANELQKGLLHFRVNPVPEPTAALVFGAGLLVMRSAGRKRA